MNGSTRGFTLIELMIAVVVIGALLTLAAPSFYDFILVQRLKGINAQLVTDLQFARSMATSRNVDVHVAVKPVPMSGTLSCYSIYSDSSASPDHKCDCSQPAGLRCPQTTTQEIRTVQVPVALGVRLGLRSQQATGFAYTATTGGIRTWPVDFVAPAPDFVIEASIDANRKLRTEVGLSGRTSVCAPASALTGSPPCPGP
jgi:type IV fimbrial biogenesis protein FimT